MSEIGHDFQDWSNEGIHHLQEIQSFLTKTSKRRMSFAAQTTGEYLADMVLLKGKAMITGIDSADGSSSHCIVIAPANKDYSESTEYPIMVINPSGENIACTANQNGHGTVEFFTRDAFIEWWNRLCREGRASEGVLMGGRVPVHED